MEHPLLVEHVTITRPPCFGCPCCGHKRGGLSASTTDVCPPSRRPSAARGNHVGMGGQNLQGDVRRGKPDSRSGAPTRGRALYGGRDGRTCCTNSTSSDSLAGVPVWGNTRSACRDPDGGTTVPWHAPGEDMAAKLVGANRHRRAARLPAQDLRGKTTRLTPAPRHTDAVGCMLPCLTDTGPCRGKHRPELGPQFLLSECCHVGDC